jgi:hypothetical protein
MEIDIEIQEDVPLVEIHQPRRNWDRAECLLRSFIYEARQVGENALADALGKVIERFEQAQNWMFEPLFESGHLETGLYFQMSLSEAKDVIRLAKKRLPKNHPLKKIKPSLDCFVWVRGPGSDSTEEDFCQTLYHVDELSPELKDWKP